MRLSEGRVAEVVMVLQMAWLSAVLSSAKLTDCSAPSAFLCLVSLVEECQLQCVGSELLRALPEL